MERGCVTSHRLRRLARIPAATGLCSPSGVSGSSPHARGELERRIEGLIGAQTRAGSTGAGCGAERAGEPGRQRNQG